MAISPALLAQYALMGLEFAEKLSDILRRARGENWTPEQLQAEWVRVTDNVKDANRAWEDAASGDQTDPAAD